MPAWLAQNIGTVLVCAVLIAVFALLIRSLVRDKKKGKSSCCGGCAGCAMAGQCHGKGEIPPPPAGTSAEKAREITKAENR